MLSKKVPAGKTSRIEQAAKKRYQAKATSNGAKIPASNATSGKYHQVTSPQGAASHTLNSDRFLGRKHSGPSGLFNSEAYKAYYTHSAANNAALNAS